MEYNFKALNYLGSKFRLLDFIEEKILSITSKGEGICDLFAGSGCVSYRLSQNFPIISCDIQSYSTTICNALLKKNNVSKTNINNFISILQKETKLLTSFYPLIKIEEEAIFSKQVETLTEIIEKGSLEVYTLENKESSLSPSMKDVL